MCTLWVIVTATLLPAQRVDPARGVENVARVDPPATRSAPAPKPFAASIGVVDLDQAIDQYALAVQERGRLQQLSGQFNDELDGLTRRIDEIRGQMSVLKQGSSTYEDKEFELRGLMRTREDLAALRKRQFDRELEQFELAIYEDMEFAIAQVAKDRGIDVVLRVQNTIDLSPDEQKDADGLQKAKLMQFNRRSVWYTSNQVDLTPFLIKYLQVFKPRDERIKAAEAAAPKNGGKGAAGSNDGKKG